MHRYCAGSASVSDVATGRRRRAVSVGIRGRFNPESALNRLVVACRPQDSFEWVGGENRHQPDQNFRTDPSDRATRRDGLPTHPSRANHRTTSEVNPAPHLPAQVAVRTSRRWCRRPIPASRLAPGRRRPPRRRTRIAGPGGIRTHRAMLPPRVTLGRPSRSGDPRALHRRGPAASAGQQHACRAARRPRQFGARRNFITLARGAGRSWASRCRRRTSRPFR